MKEFKCPYCGSVNTSYNDDNLDDLFAIDWEAAFDNGSGSFEFEYKHVYYCDDCGEDFFDCYGFTIEPHGTEER